MGRDGTGSALTVKATDFPSVTRGASAAIVMPLPAMNTGDRPS